MRQVHPASAARRAKSAALAAEGDELVVAALAAAQPQEAVGQDAAFEEGVELFFDELRQVGAGSVFGLRDEGRGVLLHQAVQRGLLRAVTLALDPGAIRRPLGLPAAGLHARLRKWRPTRSQSVLRASIALSVACRWLPSAVGPPSGALMHV